MAEYIMANERGDKVTVQRYLDQFEAKTPKGRFAEHGSRVTAEVASTLIEPIPSGG